MLNLEGSAEYMKEQRAMTEFHRTAHLVNTKVAQEVKNYQFEYCRCLCAT